MSPMPEVRYAYQSAPSMTQCKVTSYCTPKKVITHHMLIIILLILILALRLRLIQILILTSQISIVD